ncbi:LIM-homeobox domain protein-like protein, partial [Leptotrombidium deliense]
RYATLCGGCGRVITDRYYLFVVDREWHCECLRCSSCGVNLEKSCFYRNGYIYCKQDYGKLILRWKSCARCNRTIKPTEMVMKVKTNLYYHVECFTCSICNQMFQKGDYFGLSHENIYCRLHYYELIVEKHRN